MGVRARLYYAPHARDGGYLYVTYCQFYQYHDFCDASGSNVLKMNEEMLTSSNFYQVGQSKG